MATRPNHNQEITQQQHEGLSQIKHVALDMDGTIYLGNTLFPFTKDFLTKMSNAGIGYSFLTNNPSKSVSDYLNKLSGLGIEADEENMYTTSLAAIDYIKTNYPDARKLFLLGTPSMISQFEKAGYISCADSSDDEPSGNEQPVDDDQPTLNDPNEPDYEKLYKDLVKKNQDDAARKDRSKDEDLQQASIQDAVAAYFKAKFT